MNLPFPYQWIPWTTECYELMKKDFCHEVSHSLNWDVFCFKQFIQRERLILSLVPAGLNPPLAELEHKIISRLRLANSSTLITKFTPLWSTDWHINQYKSHNDWLLVQNWTYFSLRQGNMSAQWTVFIEELLLWILLTFLTSEANRTQARSAVASCVFLMLKLHVLDLLHRFFQNVIWWHFINYWTWLRFFTLVCKLYGSMPFFRGILLAFLGVWEKKKEL